MSQIDNLIYNTLADGRDLCLPEVGSLLVRRTGAKRLSSRRLLPPQTDIVFSREQRGVALTDIIASAAEVSQERAADIYRQWLQNRRNEGGGIAIEGVGEIRDGKFLTDTQFRKLINPMGDKVIRIRPLTNWLLISFAVLSLLFAVGVAGYIIYSERSFADKMDKASVGRPAVAQVEQPAEQPVEEPTSAEPTAAEQPVETEQPAVAEQSGVAEAMQPAETQEGILPIEAGRSYAVWGVYMERVNAEAGLRTVTRRYADIDAIDAHIYRYGERYMVALFVRDSRNRCVGEVEALRERSRAFGEVWVYTARR